MIFLVLKSAIPYVLLLIFLIAVVVIGTYYEREEVILRELRKSERENILQVRENAYVKLVGKAVASTDFFEAPFSKRPCLYYYIRVEQYQKNSWVKYIDEECCKDFFLQTENERAIVKPALTYFDFRKTLLVFDYKENTGAFNEAKPHLETFLKRKGKQGKNILGFNKSLRFYEGIIEPNEKVVIKGVANWKIIRKTNENYDNSKILMLSGDAKNKLIITDFPEAIKTS